MPDSADPGAARGVRSKPEVLNVSGTNFELIRQYSSASGWIMADIPEPGRLAVPAMLDAISVYESGDGPADTSLIDLALSRLAQIDDAVVLRDESVDASNLVGGTTVGWYWLIRELADAREMDSLEVISDLRAFLDE